MNGSQQPKPNWVIKGQQDFFGGLFIMAVAVFSMWFSRFADRHARRHGARHDAALGCVLLGVLGAALVVASLLERGQARALVAPRPLFVLGALVVFGLAVRPLGLAVAGPLAIVISALASDEVRWGETILFGVLMTAFCIGLFKFALGLPIPLAPWLLGY